MNILIADDHRMMREGLRAILEREGLSVVGEAADGHEAIELSKRLHPGVVIMDISMPNLNGIDATRALVTVLPSVRVVALSMNTDERYVLAMFEAGAAGYLLKSSASEELVGALRAVSRGQRYVSPAIAGMVLESAVDALRSGAPSSRRNALDAGRPRPLSARERQVLQLIAEGRSSKEIASRLDIALPTVETHRRQIMAKLDVHSIAELTKYAIREGLTGLEV